MGLPYAQDTYETEVILLDKSHNSKHFHLKVPVQMHIPFLLYLKIFEEYVLELAGKTESLQFSQKTAI